MFWKRRDEGLPIGRMEALEGRSLAVTDSAHEVGNHHPM